MRQKMSIAGLLYIIACLFATFQPVSGQAKGINIQSGGSVNASGNSSIRIIDGSFINDGSFIASDSNFVIFEGSTWQSIDGTTPTAFSYLTVNSGLSLSISGAMASVSNILLCNGAIEANGKLTLLSTESGTALIDGSGVGVVNGNVIMQRYLSSAFGYKYLSSPFQAATASEFGDESISALYRYDENRLIGGIPVSGWVNYNSPSNVLNPLAGYAVNFGSDTTDITVDMTGVVNNGDLSVLVYNHDHPYTKGFNLCGNPYPSPIDWNLVNELSASIDDALYYFKASMTDPYLGAYSTFINGISDDGIASNIIASMQGFFVHVPDGDFPVTRTLAMNNSVRVTDRTQSFIKSGSDRPRPLIRLTADFGGAASSPDFTVIYFDEKATPGFEGNLDALKLMNTDTRLPNLFSVTDGGEYLSINGMPLPDGTPVIIPLGLRTQQEGMLHFAIKDVDNSLAGMYITLHDNATGTVRDLGSGGEFDIYLPAGAYLNRFFLKLSSTMTGIAEDLHFSDLFRVIFSKGIMTTEIFSLPAREGVLRVYNLSGQLLLNERLYDKGRHDFYPNLNDGIYIVSFSSGEVRSSKRLLVINQ